jgi:hypothetical protein
MPEDIKARRCCTQKPPEPLSVVTFDLDWPPYPEAQGESIHELVGLEHSDG